MAEISRGRCPTTIEKTIEELRSCLNASKINECTGRLKLVISDLKNKFLRTSSAAEEFMEHGGLRELVGVTKMCGRIRDSILGTAIGCLANICALSRNARAKITEEDLKWFGTLLQNTTSPKIFNCIARLIGNVAKDPENVLALQESLAVPELAKGLPSCNDIDCKQSIIRAICILAKYKELRKIIHDNNGFNALLECLKSEDTKVSLAAIFAIEVFVLNKEVEYLTELCTPGGQGLVTIIKLMDDQTMKCIKPALSIISTCASNPDFRAHVGTSGAVESLIQMCSDPQLNKFLPKMITILCSLCNNVIGRQKMKDFGGLKMLIANLNDAEFPNLRTNILSAIGLYYFDETTLRFMVERLELHKALVSCLNRDNDDTHASDEKVDICSSEEEVVGVDSQCSFMQSSPSTMSRSSTPSSLQDTDDIPKDQLSSFPPDLSVISYKAQDLPSTTATTAEESDIYDESEKLAVSLLSSDLDTSLLSFSSSQKRQPLYIDISSTTHTPPNFVDSILSSPKAYRSPLIHSPTNNCNFSISDQVSVLLSRISLISHCQESLASADTLTSILKYTCSVTPCNLYCLKTLKRVLNNPRCFEKAILAFIPSVIWRDMCTVPWPSKQPTESGGLEIIQPIALESEDRTTCEPTVFAFYLKRLVSLVNSVSRSDPGCPTYVSAFANTLQYRGAELLSVLCKVAESPFGAGVLCSMLLRGGCQEKEACVSAIPFVCHSLQIVRKLMLDYGGLDNLIELVSNCDNEGVQQIAISSLVFLMQSIKCQSSLRVDKSTKTKCHQEEVDKEASSSEECQYKADPSCPFDVEILVYPSGTDNTNRCYKFSAHKEILSKISEVFCAMLGGSFSESKSGKIILRSVRPRAFLAMLHHLYGCNWNCTQGEHELNSFLTDACIDDDKVCKESDVTSGTVDCTPNDSLNPDHLISLIFTTETTEARESENCFVEARQCLELLACANRFLLMDLCAECEKQLCSCLPLDSTGIHLPNLFVYCQIHEAKILPQLILDYILLQLGNPSLCSKLFREILAGPTGYAALMLIKQNICSFIKR